MTEIISVTDVHKSYKLGKNNFVRALRGATLSVSAGQMTAIMGPSGSGKSTLMHLMGCLDRPDKGEVYLAGERVDDLPKRKLPHLRAKKMGFIFQGFNLVPTLTALENVGLAAVLAKYFGVKLDKRYQRADWSRRPLSDGMVRYAAEDTRHLHKLVGQLEKRLEEKGRRSWIAEEFALLEQVRHNGGDEGPLFLRTKGAWNLDRRQLAVLEGLLQWRDSEACGRDCPLFKVIGNKPLLELARVTPCTVEGIKTVEGVFPRLADRYGKALAKVIETAMALPGEQLPIYPRKNKLSRNQAADSRLKALKQWRAKKAAELGMEPGIVINNALLEKISRNPPAGLEPLEEFSTMKNWQRRVLGTEILEVLR